MLLDEAIASSAVFVIVSGSDGRADGQYLLAFCSRPEVASDGLSGGAVLEGVGMDVLVNLLILGQTVLEIFEPLTS